MANYPGPMAFTATAPKAPPCLPEVLANVANHTTAPCWRFHRLCNRLGSCKGQTGTGSADRRFREFFTAYSGCCWCLIAGAPGTYRQPPGRGNHAVSVSFSGPLGRHQHRTQTRAITGFTADDAAGLPGQKRYSQIRGRSG